MVEQETKKLDRRVVKTKKAIRNSFLKLLTEKDIDKVTVKEIADGADVDRKTVYNYYMGVDEILEELENELAMDFEKTLIEFRFESVEAALSAFYAFSEFLQANMEMYTLLMKIDGRSRLMEKIVAYLKEKVRSVLEHTSVEAAKIDLAVEYVTSGMFMAYRYWFNSDRKQSLEDFTDDIATLVIGGLPTYFMEIE